MEDSKFLTELFKQQNGQVSDSESSISDADCEALINSEQDSDIECIARSSPQNKVASSKPENRVITQPAINVEILAQLETLSKRLDSIETSVGKQCVSKVKSKKVKKQVDPLVSVSPVSQACNVPDLNVLRQGTSVQAAGGCRKKQVQKLNHCVGVHWRFWSPTM